MKISKAIFRHEALGDQQPRGCSKKSVQQGHRHFCARSVLAVREHRTMVKTLLSAFFNRLSLDLLRKNFLLSRSGFLRSAGH